MSIVKLWIFTAKDTRNIENEIIERSEFTASVNKCIAQLDIVFKKGKAQVSLPYS